MGGRKWGIFGVFTIFRVPYLGILVTWSRVLWLVWQLVLGPTIGRHTFFRYLLLPGRWGTPNMTPKPIFAILRFSEAIYSVTATARLVLSTASGRPCRRLRCVPGSCTSISARFGVWGPPKYEKMRKSAFFDIFRPTFLVNLDSPGPTAWGAG